MKIQNLGWLIAGILIILILSASTFYFGYKSGQDNLKNQLNDEAEFPLRYKEGETNETFFINMDLDKYCVALLQQAQAQQGR